MLATRAALLLKQRRPCAAIRDCCAALMINQDCGKAYHVRGVAHRKLGHWKRAHRDISKAQRLDFSEDSVSVHMFVAKKAGVLENQATGSWYGSGGNEGAKKAVEMLFTAEGQGETVKKKTQPKLPSVDLRPGQAVRIFGLTKAPQLNGKRGLVHKQNDKDPDRWDIELRMERGKLEIKSISSLSIKIIRAADAKVWQLEEKVHLEERQRRSKDERKWQEEDERKKRMAAQTRAAASGGFPDMDEAEQLEAEMSGLPLDAKAMGLLRRLKARDALDLINQAGIASVAGNLSQFVKIKVRQRLGEPDSDDDGESTKRSEQAAKAAAEVALKVEARILAQARADGAAAAAYATAAKRKAEGEPPKDRYDPEADAGGSDSESDEDFDLMPEEKEPLPPRGHVDEEPSEAKSEELARWKNEAVCASEDGDLKQSLQRYNQIFSGGGATALMLAKRAELLLKLSRPCAAIRDCTAAIEINPDLGKAHRVRGITNRKLGRWVEAHEDLTEAQRLDYDEGTAAVFLFVKEKAARAKRSAPKRQRHG